MINLVASDSIDIIQVAGGHVTVNVLKYVSK